MTDDNLITSGHRGYGATPVSVFKSLVVDAETEMSLCERGQMVAETLHKPEIMTLDEYFSYSNEFSNEIYAIRHTRDKEKIKSLKKHKFPCVSIAAVLNSRSDQVPENRKIERYNGLVVLNIDNLEDPEETKHLLSELPYVFYAGLSICGRGLFAIIPVEATDYHEHGIYFKAIQAALLELGISVDDTGANPCWTRLASIDERPYRNDNCAVFSLNRQSELQQQSSTLQLPDIRPKGVTNFINSRWSNFVFS